MNAYLSALVSCCMLMLFVTPSLGQGNANEPRSVSEIEKDFPERGSLVLPQVRHSLAVEYCAAKLAATKSEVQAAVNIFRTVFGRGNAPPRAAELFYCYSERQAFFNLEYASPSVTQAPALAPQPTFIDVASLPSFMEVPALETGLLREKMLTRVTLERSYSILRVHPSSKLFYLGRCGVLDTYNASFMLLHSLTLGDCSKRGAVTAIAFSADGQRIALGMSKGDVLVGSALLAQATEDTWKVCVGHTRLIKALQFSRDATVIFSVGDDGTARVWNSETCVEEQKRDASGAVEIGTNGLAYVFDLKKGKVVYENGEVRQRGEITIADLRSGQVKQALVVPISVSSRIILDEITQTLFVGGGGAFTASVDLRSGRSRSIPDTAFTLQSTTPAAVSRDGRLFGWVNGDTAYVHDTQASQPQTLKFVLASEPIASIDFVADRPNVLVSLTEPRVIGPSTITAWLVFGQR